MICVYLCDDNPVILDKYQTIIKKIAKKNEIPVSVKCFSSGEQLLFNFEEDPNQADLIYLDILMDHMDGIEVGQHLRQMGCRAEIIYLTTSEDYVFNGYDVNAYHYILKDKVTSGKFEQIFVNVTALLERKKKDIFRCSKRGDIRLIPYDSIYYFECFGREITVHYENNTFSFYSSMNKLMEQLDKNIFFRCHRSYIINLKYLDGIHIGDLILTNTVHVPLGISYTEKLKLAYSSYLSNTF